MKRIYAALLRLLGSPLLFGLLCICLFLSVIHLVAKYVWHLFLPTPYYLVAETVLVFILLLFREAAR